MTPDLSRRIAFACARGAATPDERQQLIDAAGPPSVRSADSMPADAFALLTDLESRPRAGSEVFVRRR